MSWWIFWTLNKKNQNPSFMVQFLFVYVVFWGDVSQFWDVQIQEIYSSLTSEVVLKKILLSRLSDSWRNLNVYVDVSPWKIYNDPFTVDFHGSCCKML